MSHLNNNNSESELSDFVVEEHSESTDSDDCLPISI